MIENKFNLNDYVNQQRENILLRYEKHKADGHKDTLSHYIEHYWVKLGYAKKFHDEYERTTKYR